MYYKKIFLLLIILPILLLSVMGCASSQEEGNIQTEPQEEGGTQPPKEPIPAPPQESPSIPPSGVPSEPSPPYTLDLSFPNGAPALNQVAELKVVAIHKTRVMNNVHIYLILSEGFELISGNLTWSASSLPYGETEVINAQIKAKKTGNWTIEARLNEAQSTSYPEGGARHPIYVSVLEDSAEWRNYPPYSDLTGQPGQMKADPDVTEDYPEPPAAPPPQ